MEEVFDLVLCENSAAAGLKHTSRILRRKIERIEQREDERATERGERALVARAGKSGSGKTTAASRKSRVSGKGARKKKAAPAKTGRKKAAAKKRPASRTSQAARPASGRNGKRVQQGDSARV